MIILKSIQLLLIGIIIFINLALLSFITKEEYTLTGCLDNRWAYESISAWDLVLPLNENDFENIKIGIIDTYLNNNEPGFDHINVIGENNDYDSHGTKISRVLVGNSLYECEGILTNIGAYFFPISSDELNAFTLKEAIKLAVLYEIDVLNISLGTYNKNKELHNEVISATDNGMIIIASAGNELSGAYNYPASFPQVISVGALDRNLNVHSETNYNDKIDIFAPGEKILHTSIEPIFIYGTSVATPYVTGLIVIMKLLNKDMPNNDIIDLIKETSIKYPGTWNGQNIGINIINYKNAIYRMER